MEKSSKPPKHKPDWAAIKAHYRTDVLSNRELAKQNGVSDGAIRKRAKAEGWQRDLKAQVQAEVLSALTSPEESPPVRTEVRKVRTPYTQVEEVRTGEVRTDRDIVDSVAAMVVGVVREHRTHLTTGRGIVRVLMGQLMQAAGSRADLESDVMALSEADLKGQSRTALQKALSLASHAVTLRDLSNALKNLVLLERLTYGVDKLPPPEPVRVEDAADIVDAKYRMLSTKIAERLGRAA